MKICGYTTENKPVVSNVFKLVATHGIPLPLVVDYLTKHGYVIAWDEFIIDAKREKWNPKTIYAKIYEALEYPNIQQHFEYIHRKYL